MSIQKMSYKYFGDIDFYRYVFGSVPLPPSIISPGISGTDQLVTQQAAGSRKPPSAASARCMALRTSILRPRVSRYYIGSNVIAEILTVIMYSSRYGWQIDASSKTIKKWDLDDGRFEFPPSNQADSLTSYRPQSRAINDKCGDTRSKPANPPDPSSFDCKEEQIIKSAWKLKLPPRLCQLHRDIEMAYRRYAAVIFYYRIFPLSTWKARRLSW